MITTHAFKNRCTDQMPIVQQKYKKAERKINQGSNMII